MMKATPATREHNMKRSIDITRIGHDTLDDEHEKLKKSILEIFRFQHYATPKDEPIIFQFRNENQYMIEPHLLNLMTASASIEPVVNHYKTQMFQTEMMAKGLEAEMEMEPVQRKSKKDEPDAESKQSIGDRILGRPKKRLVSKDDPYRISVPFYSENMKKLERVERFVEYQAYGVDLAEIASKAGMDNYLRFHRTRFKFDVAYPLVRSHKAHIEIIKANEKHLAGAIASSISQEIFATRNDFQLANATKPQ